MSSQTFFGHPLFDGVDEERIPLPTGLEDWPMEKMRSIFRTMLTQKGTYCPCCGQFCKVYSRSLNSGMAAGLIWLVRVFEVQGDWVEPQKTAPRYVLANREMGKLRHWGLAALKPNTDDPSKRSTGLWMPTPPGMEFVYGQLDVPATVYLYLNEVLGFENRMINIREALGKKFDYEELMRGGGMGR